MLTSPARIRLTGTSSVGSAPACWRADRSTSATARSTSSSSSPRTRCNGETSLTPRWCHVADADESRQRPRQQRTIATATRPARRRAKPPPPPQQHHQHRGGTDHQHAGHPRRNRHGRPGHTGRPLRHAQHPPQFGAGETDQQLRTGRPQHAQHGRRAAQHGDRRDHRRHREIGERRHQAEPARDTGDQRSGHHLRGPRNGERIGQRLGPASRRPGAATRPAR